MNFFVHLLQITFTSYGTIVNIPSFNLATTFVILFHLVLINIDVTDSHMKFITPIPLSVMPMMPLISREGVIIDVNNSGSLG